MSRDVVIRRPQVHSGSKLVGLESVPLSPRFGLAGALCVIHMFSTRSVRRLDSGELGTLSVGNRVPVCIDQDAGVETRF